MIEEQESESNSERDASKRMTVMEIAKEQINERMLINDNDVLPMH